MKQQILLLHGALGSKKQLQPLQDLLQKKFEVHSINFEGHGSSVSDQDFSIALFTQNVIDYLAQHSIENINIFGYSMGGYVALNAALHHPEKIKRIVTLGTKLDWSKESAPKEIKMLNPEIIEAKVPHFADKLKAEHAPQDWKNVMSKTARLMHGMADGKKLFDKDFEAIQHAVTIGIGDADKMVSLKESQHVANLLPHAILKVLEGIEHPIDKIDPERIASYIAERMT